MIVEVNHGEVNGTNETNPLGKRCRLFGIIHLRKLVEAIALVEEIFDVAPAVGQDAVDRKLSITEALHEVGVVERRGLVDMRDNGPFLRRGIVRIRNQLPVLEGF
jgi:hypothetical protein